jgi:hypothetical protein
MASFIGIFYFNRKYFFIGKYKMEIQSKGTVAFYQDIKGNIISPLSQPLTVGQVGATAPKTPRLAKTTLHFDWKKGEEKGQRHEKEKQS